MEEILPSRRKLQCAMEKREEKASMTISQHVIGKW